MRISEDARQVGPYTVCAVQLDNGPWVGVVIADIDMEFVAPEDALRHAFHEAVARHEAVKMSEALLRRPRHRDRRWYH